jgi:hypothetical protein
LPNLKSASIELEAGDTIYSTGGKTKNIKRSGYVHGFSNTSNGKVRFPKLMNNRSLNEEETLNTID